MEPQRRFRWESLTPVWGAASGRELGLEWGAQTSGVRRKEAESGLKTDEGRGRRRWNGMLKANYNWGRT